MSDGLNDTIIQMECMLNQFFPVSGSYRITDFYPIPAGFIDFLQLLANNSNRISLAGAVITIERLKRITHQNKFCGGGTTVDSKISITAVICNILPRNICFAVTVHKLVVLLFVCKQRLEVMGGF